MSDRIAITGTGLLCAAGAGAGALFEAMLAGESYFSNRVPSGQTLPWPASRLRPEQEIWPDGRPWNSVRKYANPTARISVTVAGQALGVPLPDPFRGATVVAVSSSGGDELSDVIPGLAVKAVTDDRALAKFLYDEVPDYSYIRGIPSQMGQFVSIANGFRGSNVAIYGETGVHGLGALSLATRLIDSGEVDSVMIVGVSPTPAVSSLVPLDTEEPLAQKAASGSGPFDAARQGTLVGQGAAAVLLERESSALARGIPILARLDGCQVLTSTDRQTSLAGALTTVLRRAQSDTGLWFANAAGSPVGDRAEFDVVHHRIGAAGAPVTSTRGTIGTAFETAALIDVVTAVEALRRRQAPPIGLLSAPDPGLAGLDPVLGVPADLAENSGVLVTAWNHGDSSGSAGAAFISPGETS